LIVGYTIAVTITKPDDAKRWLSIVGRIDRDKDVAGWCHCEMARRRRYAVLSDVGDNYGAEPGRKSEVRIGRRACGVTR
jgi:hypothetical protein